MRWQYRTILFEFQKDGLLGDKYIDDDEMEHVLNEHGKLGWELVSVTPVQEGLLSFFKRAVQQPRKSLAEKSGIATKSESKKVDSPSRDEVNKTVEIRENQNTSVKKQLEKPGQQTDVVGEIKIRS